MKKQGILTGALIGGGLGAMKSPSNPELGAVGGGILGAGIEHGIQSIGKGMLLPSLIAGGAFLGHRLLSAAPETGIPPAAGAAAGAGGGMLLAHGLSRGLGKMLGLRPETRKLLRIPRRLGFMLGLPLLVGAGALYLFDRAKKEREALGAGQRFFKYFQ